MTVKEQYEFIEALAKKANDPAQARKLRQCAASLYDLWMDCKMQVMDDMTHHDDDGTISTYTNKNSAA